MIPRAVLVGLLGYLVLVVGLQIFVGVVQFEARHGLTITTIDDAGDPRERELGRYELDGRVYVSAHDWPRTWYREARARPRVTATIERMRGELRAVPVVDVDRIEGLETAFPLPLWFRFVTGFAPRAFLRLDPVSPETTASP